MSPKEITDYAKLHNITKAAAAKRLLRMNNESAVVLPASPPMESGAESCDDPTDIEDEGSSGSI
jgi:hypothetical protein